MPGKHIAAWVTVVMMSSYSAGGIRYVLRNAVEAVDNTWKPCLLFDTQVSSEG